MDNNVFLLRVYLTDFGVFLSTDYENGTENVPSSIFFIKNICDFYENSSRTC
jgi:hypothetical protein